jgi:malonyl-CoA O-methyltransferase
MSATPRDAWRAFSRASAVYDAAAVLQAAVRAELLGRLDVVRTEPRVVLDLGCGTAHSTRALEKRFPRARVIAMDAAHGMLVAARAQQRWWRRFPRVQADAAALPLASASVDLLFSNLMLQWCPDLDRVFAEFQRVLRPDGLLHFTTFGPDTLCELRAAFAAVDDRDHVNAFADMHEIGEGLVRAGFAAPVLDVDRHLLTYPDALELMRDLKAIGANQVVGARQRGLTGRGRIAAMQRAYEAERRDGRLPATYEVVYGHAWRGQARQRSDGTGSVAVPLASIGRRGGNP